MRPTALRPSPTWRTFLDTHLRDLMAIDFFLVSTLTFRLLSFAKTPSGRTSG